MKALSQILECCLYAADLPAAERFYGDVLGLTLQSRAEGRHVFFRCGEGMLLLFNPQATAAAGQGVPPHGASGPGHVAFAIPESDIDGWRVHLSGRQVAIETEISWPAGGKSLYFRDPAGNSLELATRGIWGLPPRAGND